VHGFLPFFVRIEIGQSRGVTRWSEGPLSSFLVALLLLSGILRGRRMTTSLRTEGAAVFDSMPWGKGPTPPAPDLCWGDGTPLGVGLSITFYSIPYTDPVTGSA